MQSQAQEERHEAEEQDSQADRPAAAHASGLAIRADARWQSTMPLAADISLVPAVHCITPRKRRNADGGRLALPSRSKLLALAVMPYFTARSTAAVRAVVVQPSGTGIRAT